MNINKTTLGLDIGVTSIGWALLDLDNEKIIRLGVRKFIEPRVPKTGETLTSKRGSKRRARRTGRRRSHRKERLLHLFLQEGLITIDEFDAIKNKKQTEQNLFHIASGQHKSPWQLRAEGLTRLLDRKEWARVLYHLTKHRGYQSNSIERRREEGKKNDAGLLLSGISKTRSILEEYNQKEPNQKHTAGEVFYKEYPDKLRNTEGRYNKTIGREEILNELSVLFEEQKRLGNPHTASSFYENVKKILNSRRHFSQGPGGESPYGGNLIERMVGYCTLDPLEKRAPKASYTATQFRLLQTINNIRVGNAMQRNTPLSPEQKKAAIEWANAHSKMDYSQLRSAISLDDGLLFQGLRYNLSFRDLQGLIFNNDKEYYQEKIKGRKDILPQISAILDREYPMVKENKKNQLMNDLGMNESLANKLLAETENPERKDLHKQMELKRIEKMLIDNNQDHSSAVLDEIARILTIFKEEEACKKLAEYGLPSALSEELASYSFSSFMNLSIKTMKKLIPHLKDGCSYDEACQREGFDHAQSQINRDNITNPTVFRAFNQTQKVVKAIIREYGFPEKICLEVARDLSKNKKERDAFQNTIDQNEERRRIEENQFLAEVGRSPIGREAQIWRYYKEQNGQCLYCGNPLGDPGIIFSTRGAPLAEIEHTLPYSRSLDNRQCNKTAACTECNRNKGNKTPFEYFGSDEANTVWREFKARCEGSNLEKQKKEILLTTDWDEQASGERQLNDTRYITRLVQNWFEKEPFFEGRYISTPKKGAQRNVYTIKGAATSVIRKIWQLERHKYNSEKIRESEKNHALDAAVAAAATVRQIQVISNSNRTNHLYENVDNEYRPAKKIEKLFPQPWPDFSRELLALYGYKEGVNGYENDPNEIMKLIPGAAEKYNIEEQPLQSLFISWMPNRSVKGAIHKDTIYRVKEVPNNETGKPVELFFKRIPLKKLNYKNLETMAGAVDCQTGEHTPLYQILKSRLDQFNGNPEKAFEKPVFKGNKPGAPEIKKVRIRETVGGGMRILNGAAENGDMIRIDIFQRLDRKGNSKYYIIPIYTKHRAEPELPLKAIKANSPETEWDTMATEEFLFSLYPNDYLSVLKKSGEKTEGYYVSCHRGTATITLHPHDSRKEIHVSIKTGVKEIAKYDIDLLGNRHPVTSPEKRVPLRKPGQNG